MKKQITAALIAAFVLVTFTACSDHASANGLGDQRSVSESNSSASGEGASAVDSSAPAESAEPVGGSSSSSDTMPYSAKEVIQMMKPIKEYISWDHKMFPPDGNAEIVDKEQTITAKRSYSDTPISFFKVVKGDVQTEDRFMAKLSSLLTEKAKKAVLEAPVRYFEFNNGDLYIAMPGPGGSGGPGYDYFTVDKIEYINENTVAIKVTGVYNGSDAYEPYSNTGTATLVKTDDSFLIDEYDNSIANILLNCNKLVYNGETIEISK